MGTRHAVEILRGRGGAALRAPSDRSVSGVTAAWQDARPLEAPQAVAACPGIRERRLREASGGEAGIRTLGRGLSPYNGLANRRLKPLGHLTARS